MNGLRAARGFTLLEILVALTIFAVAAVALVKSINNSARNLSEVELRQFAGMVAHNQMVATQLAAETVTATGEVDSGGRQFVWRRQATKTEDPRIVRIDIDVSLPGENSSLIQLTGFIGKGEQ